MSAGAGLRWVDAVATGEHPMISGARRKAPGAPTILVYGHRMEVARRRDLLVVGRDERVVGGRVQFDPDGIPRPHERLRCRAVDVGGAPEADRVLDAP